MNGEWTFTLDEEHWNNDSFPSKEEAILAGKEYYSTDFVSRFYVGQIIEPEVKFNVENIIDDVDENYHDQCGEYASNWYKGITPADKELLQEMIGDTFSEWLIKTKNKPSFYTIANSEEVLL
ncbi:hypothetical protein NDS46_29945 (plasmid) [Paenibacillus thiaminolyticus]|uniref:hypothetical protein n=1 Tax=Paenibacillus thiaminolyticus TaxID=49283 RepID=UPI00232D7275|nr:hypothetical protein [Paenibacillus thiaminolyticus]WCF11571.1 hypothetical protein NDS46_29945 [Paenibacillus thiaminolyticus]